MHNVCSTLITSTEEIYKAIRRKVCYRIASIFMWVASRVIKNTAKYFTKDELENLRKDNDELNAAMTVMFACKLYRKRIGNLLGSLFLVLILLNSNHERMLILTTLSSQVKQNTNCIKPKLRKRLILK